MLDVLEVGFLEDVFGVVGFLEDVFEVVGFLEEVVCELTEDVVLEESFEESGVSVSEEVSADSSSLLMIPESLEVPRVEDSPSCCVLWGLHATKERDTKSTITAQRTNKLDFFIMYSPFTYLYSFIISHYFKLVYTLFWWFVIKFLLKYVTECAKVTNANFI